VKSKVDVIEDYLAFELEGGLFEYITLRYCGRDYVARRTFYMVKEGKVYELSKDGPYATGDTLLDLKTSCHRVGNYDPNFDYQAKNLAYNHEKILETLGLL
jgi:hypothetical protein